MKNQLTFDTFDTQKQAEMYAESNNIKAISITYSDFWRCWVLWHR